MSDNSGVQIGNGDDQLKKDFIYNICTFEGSSNSRKLFFSDAALFNFTEAETFEFVDEDENVLFSRTETNANSYSLKLSFNIKSSEKEKQTLGVRFKIGTKLQINLGGLIFIVDGSDSVVWGSNQF